MSGGGRPGAAVIVVSDRAASGERPDRTFGRLRPLLEGAGFAVVGSQVVDDDRERIAAVLRAQCERGAALVVTTGGTGIGDRDVTPEATLDVVERQLPGVAEAMRAASFAETPFAPLSRAVAGVAGRTVVVNLPGSPEGAVLCLDTVLPALGHAVRILAHSIDDCREDRPPRRPRPA